MLKRRHCCFLIVLIMILTESVFFNLSVAEADNSFSTGFNHLLEITTGNTRTLDLNKIEAILDHVASFDYQTKPDYSGGLKDAPSAYYGYRIESTMRRMLCYCYNANISACAVLPEYIRLSSWLQTGAKSSEKTPELWKLLDDIKEPVIITGCLYLQNTPDVNTGAYYGYNSFKSNILLNYNQKNVFISVSKQKDTSEVGKKGFVLGNYKDLTYFYSGKPGLNKIGLGKIKSYLYDGFSVSVYIESEKSKKGLQCVTFKWLKGGWAGMNMIRTKHIQKGLKRFAGLQKKLLETNQFPDYNELSGICSKYKHLPEKEMKKLMGAYLCKLQHNCNAGTNCPRILKNGFNIYEYIDKMSQEEMRATLIVDHIKCRLNNLARLNEIKITLNN